MSDFYRGKNVVVLGGAGFVGHHLCEALLNRGAIVHVIDNLSRGFNQEYPPDTHNHKVDIARGGRIFTNVMSNINPFAVFNLAAAVAGVEYNQTHQSQMFLDNVQLQTIPVQACELLGIPHYLQVSSVCVYGEGYTQPAVESELGGDPTAANAGYAWSKRMGEKVVQWSRLPHAVIVRPSNIYGPGDWYDDKAHVIPKLIKGYANGTAKLFNAEVIRVFIYVADVVGGMIYALEHGADKEVYNISTLDMIQISMLHEKIASLCEAKVPAPVESTFNQGDKVRYSSYFKLQHLGWEAGTSLEDGLALTVQDYYDNR